MNTYNPNFLKNRVPNFILSRLYYYLEENSKLMNNVTIRLKYIKKDLIEILKDQYIPKNVQEDFIGAERVATKLYRRINLVEYNQVVTINEIDSLPEYLNKEDRGKYIGWGKDFKLSLSDIKNEKLRKRLKSNIEAFNASVDLSSNFLKLEYNIETDINKVGYNFLKGYTWKKLLGLDRTLFDKAIEFYNVEEKDLYIQEKDSYIQEKENDVVNLLGELKIFLDS